MVIVGDKAPDFKGTKVAGGRFEDFRLSKEIGGGPLVLEFYPFAFSGGCTRQVCDLRDAAPALYALKAKVIAVSADSHFVLREFAKTHGLPYPLVSDPQKEGIRAWGIAYDEFLGVKGVAKRSVFVIDGRGTVQYAWVSNDAEVRPSVDELKGVLAKLK